MGNVNRVLQVEPTGTTGGGGAAIPVRRSSHELVRAKRERFEQLNPFHRADPSGRWTTYTSHRTTVVDR